MNFERGSAPPISLSSPELGAESEGFEEHIRNSYSSSELLYERNLNRFNGYSNDENSSSEAQKIAIYAMDRKNSLRRSPITRSSNDGSEEKSIFNDSDSIHSVVEFSNKTNASSFMSLANSISKEFDDDVEENINNDVEIPSTSFTGMQLDSFKGTNYEESLSDNSSEEEFIRNFRSGKHALEHNTSSAFFSTVYYDDDYLSDQKLSDRERSVSPAPRSPKPSKKESIEKSDVISQDSLNTGSVSSSDYSQIDKENNDEETFSEKLSHSQNITENKIDSAEVLCTDEPVVQDKYRPRDGIPKFVMLPNPFYKENLAPTENSNQVKFELSTNSHEIVPPEIPKREVNGSNHVSIPVITVTEMSEHSPKSILKKIFVPSFSGPTESYFNKYNNVNSSAFKTLRKPSPERDVTDEDDLETTEAAPPEEDAEMVAVKHYGDIVEAYSGVTKKPVSMTYMDFEQLKMAAVEDEPVVVAQDQQLEEEYDGQYWEEDLEEEKEQIDTYANLGELSHLENDYGAPTSTDNQQLTIVETPVPNTIPYLKIFGNLSLALFGYWLYMCKDERLAVPIFGFLSLRIFKSQVWDRI